MNYVKLNLIVTAVILGGYGLRGAFDPIWAADSLGLVIASAEGSISLRSVYGGWMIGVAILLLTSLKNEQLTRFALLAILCIISPILLARISGIMIENYTSVDQILKLAMEVISVTFTSVLLLRSRRAEQV